MNKFVTYLNGLHNYNAQNQNAYGERNVQSEYYAKTIVKIDICDHIIKLLNDEEPHMIILTGHAGDGKTSIMFQVLENMGMNPQFTEPVYNMQLGNGHECCFIKDFSELSDTKKLETLKEIIQYPEGGRFVFMVANTGPLINTFGCLFPEGEERDRAKMDMISAMDSNDGMIKDISGYRIAIINMASIENTGFAEQYLKKVIDNSLWSNCEECSKKEYCHILRNCRLIQKYRDSVCRFITDYYTWQMDYGTRLTIRSITEHLSYMITGGFDCDMIEPDEAHKLLFSNLFFGYEGMISNSLADNVLAVRIAKQCGIYQKRMRVDEKLLIQKDYEHLFGKDIQTIISEANEESKLLKAWDDELRRIYIFMNLESDDQHRLDTEDLFSKQFIPYCKVRNNGEKPGWAMKDLVIDALRMMYLGTVGGNKGVVQITMSAESGVMQSVQLVAGDIYTSKISLEREKDNVFNHGKYNLMLQINKKNVIKLTLPMLDYFEDLRNGVIETNMDPQLTHGIEKLKAMLLAKANVDDYSIQICMMTNTGEPESMSMYIEDGMLMVR